MKLLFVTLLHLIFGQTANASDNCKVFILGGGYLDMVTPVLEKHGFTITENPDEARFTYINYGMDLFTNYTRRNGQRQQIVRPHVWFEFKNGNETLLRGGVKRNLDKKITKSMYKKTAKILNVRLKEISCN